MGRQARAIEGGLQELFSMNLTNVKAEHSHLLNVERYSECSRAYEYNTKR